MKLKDIQVGEDYELISKKKSRPGCSEEFFEEFRHHSVTVLKKLNSFHNKNILKIQGVIHDEISGPVKLVNFWCSPYDLKEIH